MVRASQHDMEPWGRIAAPWSPGVAAPWSLGVGSPRRGPRPQTPSSLVGAGRDRRRRMPRQHRPLSCDLRAIATRIAPQTTAANAPGTAQNTLGKERAHAR